MSINTESILHEELIKKHLFNNKQKLTLKKRINNKPKELNGYKTIQKIKYSEKIFLLMKNDTQDYLIIEKNNQTKELIIYYSLVKYICPEKISIEDGYFNLYEKNYITSVGFDFFNKKIFKL